MPWWGADVRGSFNVGRFYEQVIDQQLPSELDHELTVLMKAFLIYVEAVLRVNWMIWRRPINLTAWIMTKQHFEFFDNV